MTILCPRCNLKIAPESKKTVIEMSVFHTTCLAIKKEGSMKVLYTGEEFPMKGRTFELSGGSAWTEPRFKVLKEMNPKGKVTVIETDGKQEKYLVPIGDVEIKPESYNY